ncbi:MAG: nicotinamide-nucleotide adenylyltransferase [Moraxellaceae bacterium]|nr:MAG: nicotinamide-nucleotide adenylyltransferase [Moraxellaceae bacterium]
MFVFDFLVFIGRFQPFHRAHQAVIQDAFQHSKSVIILLGSAQPERTLKNVFTSDEREAMIRASFNPEQQRQLYFAGLVDVFNDVKWTAMVKQAVQDIVEQNIPLGEASLAPKIGLIGHFKDQSSYYLSLFPEWPLVELDNYFQLSATPIREQYLLGQLPTLKQVPAATLDFLIHFQQTANYRVLQQQAQQSLQR